MEKEFDINKNNESHKELTQEEIHSLLEIEDIVHDYMKDMPEHHGVKHIDDVRQLSREICIKEKGDLFATEVATLSHDLGRKIEKEKGRPHAPLSLFEAHDYLKKLYEKGIIDLERWKTISQAIAKHAHLSEEGDELTLDIVRDADRLDAMGLSGLLRCLEHSKDRGWPFYEEGQKIIFSDNEFVTREFNKSAIGDINYVHDWRKLLRLKSAKEIAKIRLQPMEHFLRLFEKHQDIKDYDFWIKFIKYQLKMNKQTVEEKDFQAFFVEYNKEK